MFFKLFVCLVTAWVVVLFIGMALFLWAAFGNKGINPLFSLFPTAGLFAMLIVVIQCAKRVLGKG